MKLKKFLFLASAAVFMFSACTTEVEVTGITISEASVSIEKGDTTTLTATILPKGAEGTITWTSSNPAVASVTDGEVIGLTEGTTNVVATVGTFNATCVVTVTKETMDPKASLKGSNYYVIIMDGVTAASIESKIVGDLRPNDVDKFLYIWDGTYNAGTSSGPNFFGEVEAWTSLTVASSGWSGAGFNINSAANADVLASMKDITDHPEDYYLHIGIKSKDNATHAIILGGQTDVKFAIGANGFVDGAVTYPALGNFTRDGEWQRVEIPVKTLTDMGLSYSNFSNNPNVFAFLSGGVTGTTLDLDAVFFYKK
jgi:hypothetical protein